MYFLMKAPNSVNHKICSTIRHDYTLHVVKWRGRIIEIKNKMVEFLQRIIGVTSDSV